MSTLLFFMAIAWLIGFLHGWFGRGYSLKHKMYYDRVDDAMERVSATPTPAQSDSAVYDERKSMDS